MNAVHIRMNGHRDSIQHPVANGLLPGEHFSRPGHDHTDIIVSVLVGGFSDSNSRKVAEMTLIYKFDTHVEGLNRDHRYMSHYK